MWNLQTSSTNAFIPMTDNINKPMQISFDIYKEISLLRNKHGVSTEDYDIYRHYLSKQLSILRKKLKLQCLDLRNSKSQQKNNAIQNKRKKEQERKKTWKNKTNKIEKRNNKYKLNKNRYKKENKYKNREVCIKDLELKLNTESFGECLLIQLYLCERAWAYSKSIYEQFDEDNKRKYHHSNSRLKKSIIYANKLFILLLSTKKSKQFIIKNSIIYQSFGYLSWLKSIYYLQIQQVQLSFNQFLKSIKITSQITNNNNNNYNYILESNISEKLLYFNQNINKQKRRFNTRRKR
eukprot:162903_1